jgi:hypothetical protein
MLADEEGSAHPVRPAELGITIARADKIVVQTKPIRVVRAAAYPTVGLPEVTQAGPTKALNGSLGAASRRGSAPSSRAILLLTKKVRSHHGATHLFCISFMIAVDSFPPESGSVPWVTASGPGQSSVPVSSILLRLTVPPSPLRTAS